MEETKHNKAFDELIRSKYKKEEIKPAAHLWKNIQKQIFGGAGTVKPWYLSKAALIGSSAAAILGLISVLFYFVYLKPQRLSSPVVSNLKPAVSAPHASELKQNKTFSTTHRQSAYAKPFKTSITKKGKNFAMKQSKPPLSSKISPSSLRKEKRTSSRENNKKLLTVKEQNSRNPVFFITPLKEINLEFPPAIAANTTYKTIPPVKKPAWVTQLSGQKPINKTKWQKQQKAKRNYAAKSKKQKAPKKQKLRRYVLHPWSLEAFIMPEFSSRFVTPNPNYTQGVYTPSYFNSREHYTFNYSYGLLVDYRFRHWGSIEAGVSYYIYGVDFSTKGSYLIKTGDNSGIVFTSAGQTELKNIDSLNNRTTLSSSSRFGYLSIPVNVKFYPIKNLYINAGPTFDYFIGQTNNWDKHDEEGDFNVESNNVEGINRFNISFVFGLGYEKRIWKNLSFSINPGIRMHLQNLNPHNTVKTYPFNAGFRVYLRYEL